MLWASFFPLAWGWLAWVALVPLLCLVRREHGGWHVYGGAWLVGLVWFVAGLQWMRVADYRMYFTWAALALYCSLYVPVAVFLIRRLDRKTFLPLIMVAPAVWTGLEYTRTYFLTGFPWYFLGYTQHEQLPLIQVADLGGVYAVSFLVTATNVVMFELLTASPRVHGALRLADRAGRRPTSAFVARAAIVVMLLVASIWYGRERMNQDDADSGPRIGLIQGNLEQAVRNDIDSDKAVLEMFTHFRDLTSAAVSVVPAPQLVVWPETSYPAPWVVNASDQPDAAAQDQARRLARYWHVDLLLGLNVLVGEEGRNGRYNSAILVGRNGMIGERYDKIHLVPFGEYVPLREWFPLMNYFAPYDFDYSVRPGTRFTPLTFANHRIGVMICYEDTYPDLARGFVHPAGGAVPADFLINISNDGWFKGTAEHAEHLAICRFRAIESRRAVARAVNMGISAVIDGNGRALRPRAVRDFGVGADTARLWEIRLDRIDDPGLPSAEWGQFTKVAGVILAAIPLDHRSSFYAAWGDWLPLGCWIAVVAGLAGSFGTGRSAPM
jgi:apolipoprotein N-acyltransferase